MGGDAAAEERERPAEGARDSAAAAMAALAADAAAAAAWLAASAASRALWAAAVAAARAVEVEWGGNAVTRTRFRAESSGNDTPETDLCDDKATEDDDVM